MVGPRAAAITERRCGGFSRDGWYSPQDVPSMELCTAMGVTSYSPIELNEGHDSISACGHVLRLHEARCGEGGTATLGICE